MKPVRVLGRWLGALAWIAALLPAFALIPASFLDRGPIGPIRFTLFPAALAALDPHLWECARNSLLMAAAVTFASRFMGVTLARIVARNRFWGRPLLATLACAGLAVPPAFAALGLRAFFRSDPLLDWAGWFWAALVSSVPVVALSASWGLSRVDSVAEDAARLEGASRRKVWRHFVWPNVRPGVAKSLAGVFTMTLIEPGAPLVLGLRRTLGFQIVEAATDPSLGQLNRAAVLALGATLMAGLVRVLLGWWGGPEAPALSERKSGGVSRNERTGLFAGIGFFLILFMASLLVCLPLGGLITATVPSAVEPWHSKAGAAFATFGSMVRDPLSQRYLENSLAMALGVLLVGAILSWAIVAWTSERPGHSASPSARLEGVVRLFPPLAIGVGALVLPGIGRMSCDTLDAATGRVVFAPLLRSVVDVLDSDRTPGIAMTLAISLTALPLLSRSALDRRAGLPPSRVEAALNVGAGPRQARRGLRRSIIGVAPSAAFLAFAMAFSNVSPALVFATTSATRTAGPAVLTLIDEPGSGFSQAAALAVFSVGLNLLAMAIAARKRSGVSRVRLGT